MNGSASYFKKRLTSLQSSLNLILFRKLCLAAHLAPGGSALITLTRQRFFLARRSYWGCAQPFAYGPRMAAKLGAFDARRAKRRRNFGSGYRELTLAHLNIHRRADAAESLRGWRPREVSYQVGRPVIRRLIDHGRWSDVEGVSRAAGNNLCLVLAVAAELREVRETPPNEVTKQAFGQRSKNRIKLSDRDGWDDSEAALGAVTAVVEAALKANLCTQGDAAAVLTRYLPVRHPEGSHRVFQSLAFLYCAPIVCGLPSKESQSSWSMLTPI